MAFQLSSSLISKSLYGNFIFLFWYPLLSCSSLLFLNFYFILFHIFNIHQAYTINTYNFMGLVISIHTWNHQHSQCHKPIYHLQKFSPALFIIVFHSSCLFIKSIQVSQLHQIALIFSASNYEFSLFSLIFRGTINI